jgi:predicted ATP-grasp superfamily ATP-dependent carboligase
VRVFAYEFVTGGGITHLEPEASLIREADLMVRALLRDLADTPGVEVFTARRPGLPPLSGIEQLVPLPGESPFELYPRALASADAAWPIAPETDGVLERLSRQTLDLGKTLLGSPPHAVRAAASKYTTAAVLHEAGLSVVPTFSCAADIPELPGRWVVKPDDGAGAMGTRLLASARAARAALEDDPGGLVAQPWLDGEPLSLSIICLDGQALVLACNRQRVHISNGCISLAGIEVNAAFDRVTELTEIAERVVSAMPWLWGYVGVDLVSTGRGPVVLEVNPRLTTSYCGLREAIGVNVAELVLGLAQGEALPPWRIPALPSRMVELELRPADG